MLHSQMPQIVEEEIFNAVKEKMRRRNLRQREKEYHDLKESLQAFVEEATPQ